MSQSNIQPPTLFKEKARINTEEYYQKMYDLSISDPDKFWGTMADSELTWQKKWSSVLSCDWSSIGERKEAFVKWFDGGKLNVAENCLDRHIEEGKGARTAIIWEAEKRGVSRTVSYIELHQQVCKLANVLKDNGVKQGTTVGIFMPMLPELVTAVLACARLGAIHSVVFSAFSSESLKSRMQDCQASFLITADGGNYAGGVIKIKDKVDQALTECPSIKKVLIYKHVGNEISFVPGRDLWWQAEVDKAPAVAKPEAFDSENPLFILYTSGSTGKPKGVMHTSAGYLLYAHCTAKYIFDLRERDVYWCTADVGWITGHSYLIYGPLSNAATCVMYEGAPVQPDPERTWQIIQDNKVSIYYTAPTAVRLYMKLGDQLPAKYDLTSLRLLGSVGEPINPEAWRWYHKVVGGERCPIVDTWWQTETGGILISTLPGIMSMKPGSAGKPFFGVSPKVVDDKGATVVDDHDGILVLDRPWPGMLRGVYGDPSNKLIKETYFSRFPGQFFTGDGARKDSDGYYWLLGRIDDVLNVSAHRFATAELESALVSHSSVAEAAVVGFPHDIKGNGIFCFVSLKIGQVANAELAASLREQLRKEIGPIAIADKIQFCEGLPKTRSGKIMRRILRKVAEGKSEEVGDISTLADPGVVKSIIGGNVY